MSEKRQRDQALRVRVTAEEMAEITERADRAGETVGSYVRRTLLGSVALRAVRRPPIATTVVSDLLARLGPIATDLRKIAAEEMTDLPEIDDALADLKDIRDALIEALGRNP